MSVTSQIRKAKKFENLGAYDNASNVYESILIKFPKNREAQIGLKRIQKTLLEFNSFETTKQNSDCAITPEMRDRLWGMHLAKDYYTLLNYIEKYLSYNPEDYELLFMAGSCCRHVHDFHKAMDYLKKALAHEPENFGANLEVARIFADSGLTDLARQTFEHCIEAFGSKCETYFEYGKWLERNNEHKQAQTLYLQALEIFPDRYELMSHLGETFFALGCYQEAHEYFSKAMSVARKISRIHMQILHANRMNADAELGLIDSLNASVKETELLISENEHSDKLTAKPKFNLALHYLRTGETEKGWQYYRDRFKRSDFPSPSRKFEKPRANSIDDLSGETVMIWREQGVGDEIMFYNLLSTLIEKTDCKYIVECEERLLPILQKSFPEIKFRPEEFDKFTLKSPNEDFDTHFPLGDLPILLNVSQNTPNLVKSWVRIDNDIEEFWNKTLSSNNLNIGFAWESGLLGGRRNHHYASIELFENLINNVNHNWVCLQYTATNEDLKLFSNGARKKILLPDVDLKNDFENVSGIIKNCDIVLTPRTAVLSLTGAIGCRSATFRTGASGLADIGSSMGPGSITKPPLHPKATSLHLRHGLQQKQKDKLISDFFVNEITKVEIEKSLH